MKIQKKRKIQVVGKIEREKRKNNDMRARENGMSKRKNVGKEDIKIKK
jgi:hypothetical protein